MNHINALELSRSAGGAGEEEPRLVNISTNGASGDGASQNDNVETEDDGWTTVSKGGGRRRKGK